MRTIHYVLVVAVLALGLAGAVLTVRAQPGPHAVFTTAAGDQVTLNLEIADTPEKHMRGLMFRRELPEDTGMLFVFNDTVMIGFWMQNTYIPLSIAFVGDDYKIVDILDMQPETTDIHVPKSPYKYAIEANQGYFARHGVATGDSVEFVLGGS